MDILIITPFETCVFINNSVTNHGVTFLPLFRDMELNALNNVVYLSTTALEADGGGNIQL